MLSRARILFVAILLFLSFTVSSSLRCYSTICEDPDEHGFCVQTCRRPNDACLGSFIISPNHTVTPGTFLCHNVIEGECEATSCQISSTSQFFGSCCCRKDLCNIVPGLWGDNTPAPPIIIPAPSITPPPVVGNQLVCEFNNCTSSLPCYHGYQVCSSADTISSSRSDHFCSVRARRTPSEHFELESKGCIITTNATVHQEGEGRTGCILDTQSSNDDIACFCDHPFCNNGSNLGFTDSSRYVGPHGDILCNASCSHSCVISDGVPRYLCPAGYALDTDLRTCIDINECVDPHSHLCSHICINTEGSYRCDCPPNQSLRLAINGTHCEQIPGLFCARHNQDCDSINGCDDISFCDHDLNVSHDPAHESCIALVHLNNGEFVLGFQSCFINSDTCGEDECKLELPRGSNRRDVYSCCCRSNLCNTRLIYPDIVNRTEVMLLPTTVATDGTTDQEGTAANTVRTDASVEGLSYWTLPVLAAVASVMLTLLVIAVIACVITVGRKNCFIKPHGYSTPSHGSSIMSGSPTNTMKPAISEASTTLTGGAIPMTGGYPNAAVHSGHHHNLHQSNTHTKQLDAMMSSLTISNQAAVGGVDGGGPRPPPTSPGGGNPHGELYSLPSVN